MLKRSKYQMQRPSTCIISSLVAEGCAGTLETIFARFRATLWTLCELMVAISCAVSRFGHKRDTYGRIYGKIVIERAHLKVRSIWSLENFCTGILSGQKFGQSLVTMLALSGSGEAEKHFSLRDQSIDQSCQTPQLLKAWRELVEISACTAWTEPRSIRATV